MSDLVTQSTWNVHQMFTLIKEISVQNFNLVTWLVGILQTRPEYKKPRSVKYHPVTWSTWNFSQWLILFPKFLISTLRVANWQSLVKKYSSYKKLVGGGSFQKYVIFDDVITSWWRHYMMTKFWQMISIIKMCTLSKFHINLLRCSKVIQKNWLGGGICPPLP